MVSIATPRRSYSQTAPCPLIALPPNASVSPSGLQATANSITTSLCAATSKAGTRNINRRNERHTRQNIFMCILLFANHYVHTSDPRHSAACSTWATASRSAAQPGGSCSNSDSTTRPGKSTSTLHLWIELFVNGDRRLQTISVAVNLVQVRNRDALFLSLVIDHTKVFLPVVKVKATDRFAVRVIQ